VSRYKCKGSGRGGKTGQEIPGVGLESCRGERGRRSERWKRRGTRETGSGGPEGRRGGTRGRQMKVLFIEEYLPQEMLGIMWLSRAIKDAGHETKALFVPDRDWVQKLKEYSPTSSAYSVTTGMHLYLAEINQRVKRELPRDLGVRRAAPDVQPRVHRDRRHRRHLPRRGRAGDRRAARARGRGARLLRRPEPVGQGREDGRDREEPRAAARAEPRRPRPARPRRRVRGGADLPRQRPQGVRDAARLPDELLVLLPPRVEEEGLRRTTRSTRASARSTTSSRKSSRSAPSTT
jgi:hypothetical protein